MPFYKHTVSIVSVVKHYHNTLALTHYIVDTLTLGIVMLSVSQNSCGVR